MTNFTIRTLAAMAVLASGLAAQECSFTRLVSIDEYLSVSGNPVLYDGNAETKTGVLNFGKREEIYQWFSEDPVSMIIRATEGNVLPIETLAHIVHKNGGSGNWQIDFETRIVESQNIFQGWKHKDNALSLQVIYGTKKELLSVELRSKPATLKMFKALEWGTKQNMEK